ncbi:hypothetical protein A2U01_0086732, partial [Trifolium medium]|nr:hypothetical protein [Trifolium medium]
MNMLNEPKICPPNPVSISVYPPSPLPAELPLVKPLTPQNHHPQMATSELSTPTYIAMLRCS